MTDRQGALRIIGILVVVACLARVVHLNADPSVATWIGYVIDEGRWNEVARSLALFGTPEANPNARLHLFLTPGYQAVNYVVFRLLGVDFWSARLSSSVCGLLTVVVVFFSLRRRVTPFALGLGVVILGFQTDLLSESRMALPEMPSVLFTLVAFLMLTLAKPTRRNACLAGLLAAIAVAMKATTIMVIPVFPVIVLLSPQGGRARDRLMRASAFVAGFAVLVVAGLIAVLASGILPFGGLVIALGRIFDFSSLATPYIAAMRFFDSSELEARNLLLLGAWFTSWIWLHRNKDASLTVRNLYVASGAWAAWWLIAWSGSWYLPGRYIVHWIVPATIHVMAGLSLTGHDTFARIAGTLRQGRGIAHVVLPVWLVLPSAIFLAAMAASFVGLFGWDHSSLSRRIAWIVVLVAVLGAAVGRRGSRPDIVAAFLLFPVVMTLLWLAGRELGVVDGFWRFESATALATWAAMAVLIFAACIVLPRPPSNGQRLGVMEAGVLVTLAVIFFAQSAPAIVHPTYSIRDASLALQQRFPAGSEVRTFSAESLFLANALKFRAVALRETQYDGIVIFEHGLQSRNFLASDRAANLVQIEAYPVTVNPRYQAHEDQYGPASIGVYRPK